MAFQAVGRTDVGLVRKENQDDYLILHQQLIYAVADGMGGHAGGRQASAAAIEVLRRWFTGETEKVSETEKDGEADKVSEACGEGVDEACVEGALFAANAKILAEAAEKSLPGMGTTLVLAYYADAYWRVAHIGDSRAYVVGPEGIYALTKDHSLVGELLARGSITEEEAKVHPHRNVLTRALGAMGNVRPEWSSVPGHEAAYLLLCSDGLFNMVEDAVIHDIVVAADLTLEEKAERLVEEANHNGGADNITVILVKGEDGP